VPDLPEYWTEKDKQNAELAQTYGDLSVVAQGVAVRIPQPLVMVCGPISTGGLGSIEQNMVRFRKMIDFVKSLGENVFDQLPFEPYLWRIIRGPNDHGGFHLLEDFYQPLFERYFSGLYFIPDWESSAGTCWERGMAILLKKKIRDLQVYSG